MHRLRRLRGRRARTPRRRCSPPPRSSHLALLPQGQPERLTRVRAMVDRMDAEGFGACSNEGECEATCPKGISIAGIARMNRQYTQAVAQRRRRQEGAPRRATSVLGRPRRSTIWIFLQEAQRRGRCNLSVEPGGLPRRQRHLRGTTATGAFSMLVANEGAPGPLERGIVDLPTRRRSRRSGTRRRPAR